MAREEMKKTVRGNNARNSRVKHLRRETRATEAAARAEQYAKLTIEQKLAQLEKRPGASKKERAKLLKMQREVLENLVK